MKDNFVAIETICTQYEIELSFVDRLHHEGLVQLVVEESRHYIHQDQLSDLEKMIRLHRELNVNVEGIDVVFNLLQKEQMLKKTIADLKRRLQRYED